VLNSGRRELMAERKTRLPRADDDDVSGQIR